MLDGLAATDAGKDPEFFVEFGGREQNGDGFADDLVSRVAEQPLGACVPTLNDAFEVLADNRVVRGFHDRSEKLLRVLSHVGGGPRRGQRGGQRFHACHSKVSPGGCASNVRRDAKVPPDVSGPTPLDFTHSRLSNLRGRGLSQWPGQEPQRLLLRSEQSGLAGSLVLPRPRLELRRAHAAASQSDRRCLPSERP